LHIYGDDCAQLEGWVIAIIHKREESRTGPGAQTGSWI